MSDGRAVDTAIVGRDGARFACLSVDVRMAACFIEVADLVGSDNLPLTQEALAEMLSVQRTSVTAAAGKLRAEGTIAYARGKIQIQDRDQLLRLAHPALG
jgi:CRP-like cAMP-binding protein